MHRSKSLIRCKLDGHVRHVFKKRRDVPGEKSARTSGGGDSATGGDGVGVHAGLHERMHTRWRGHLDDRRTESTDATGDERDRRHGHVRPLLEQFLRRAVKRKVRTDGDAGAGGGETPLVRQRASEVIVPRSAAADANDFLPRLTAPLDTAPRPTPYLPPLVDAGAPEEMPLSVACMRTLTVSSGWIVLWLAARAKPPAMMSLTGTNLAKSFITPDAGAAAAIDTSTYSSP